MESRLPKDITDLDVDKVLDALGTAPFRTMLQVTIMGSCWVAFAFQTMIMVFITEPPAFYCTNDDTSTFTNSTSSWRTKCLPTDMSCGSNGTHYMFDVNGHHTLASEFNMMCDKYSLWRLGHSTSVFMIGGLVSALGMTQLSDMFGRRIVFVSSFFGFAVMSSLSAVCPGYSLFLICRAVTGALSVGLSGVSFVYTCELTTQRARAVVPLIMNLTWTVGYCGIGVMAMYIHDWRYLMLASSVPFLPSFLLYWFIPESLHWLVAKRQRKGVSDWLINAEKHANHDLDISMCLRDREPKDTEGEKPIVISKRTVLDIFKSPVLFFHTIVFAILASSANVVYWGLSLFSGKLSNDRYTGFFLSALIELPAGILGPMLLWWFGRRSISISSYALCGIALLALIYAPNEELYTIILSLTGKFGNMIVFSSAFLLMPEVYPTTLRNVGYGLIGTVGKLGSAAAPYIGNLSVINRDLPPGIFAFMSLLSAVLCMMLPETSGKKLPEDVCDCDPGPFLNRFLPMKHHHSFFKSHAIEEVEIPLTTLPNGENGKLLQNE